MPPLPNTVQDETSTLIEKMTRRQRDVHDLQIPRLRDYNGTLAIQQQYAAELREDLDAFARNVKNLELLAEDQERDRDRKEVARQAEQFRQSLEKMRKETRTALLTSKRAIDSLAQSNKAELLRSSALSEEKTSDDKSGDVLMNASNDVTETLRRTIGLMQGELERSVLSSQMLEQSSASLRSATTVHDSLSTLLSTSKHLITALEKSDWLDRLLILSAVAFFFLVVLFILKQRMLDKGLRIAFWWTRFLPDFHGDAALLEAEQAKAATLATSAATTLTTAMSLATNMVTNLPIPLHEEMPDDALSAALFQSTDRREASQNLPHSTTPIPSPSDSPLPTNDASGRNFRIQEL